MRISREERLKELQSKPFESLSAGEKAYLSRLGLISDEQRQKKKKLKY